MSDKKICCIYKITSPTKKVYIGQTINYNKRIEAYIYNTCVSQTKIYNSIKKYGWENHKIEILIECDECQLNELESYYGELFNCCDEKTGLNIRETFGSHGSWPQEVKDKMSKTKKGMTMTKEWRDKITESVLETNKKNRDNGIPHKNSGKKRTEKTKQKQSAAAMGKPKSEEHKKNISIGKKGIATRGSGWSVSEETKAKISKGHAIRNNNKLL